MDNFKIRYSGLKYIILFGVGFHVINILDLLYRWKRKKDLILYDIENENKQINECCFSGPPNRDCEKHSEQVYHCHKKGCSFDNKRFLI